MKKLPPRIVPLLALGVVVVVALIGWFAVVSPQRSRAARLDDEILAARTELASAKVAARATSNTQSLASQLRALSVAMPDATEMPRMLREILTAARYADVGVQSIEAHARTTQAGFDVLPMDVVLSGRFPGVTRFLFRLRTLAGTNGERVHAAGRLFKVDSLEFAPGDGDLPQLTATVHLSAFVFNSTSPPASTQDTAPPTSTSASAAGRTG